jgi:hypothetical protein
MTPRSEDLQTFLDRLKECFAAAKCEADSAVHVLLAALEQPAPAGSPAPIRLPVCQHLPAAFDIAKSASPRLAGLASAFEALGPRLAWLVRATGGPFASTNWPDGHANATIIGPERGLECRGDVAIGASLLAPHVRYPDHHHAPEEVYMVLTHGQFQHGESGWLELSSGETFHNDPNIQHAMASRDSPLLAIWCLLLK